ncbi:hypothetical protein niasHT_031077 [Heterodera trifolii]|uniref:Uncharacterized protein n=1 Tax=Heterodera trifolii TaxID=157864 RepID=A0ABD2HY30_9BILA
MSDQQSGSSSSAVLTSPTPFPQQQKPPLLRRCSMSEPHLDIVPHFLKEEKSVHPFDRVLSGLFDKGSTFSVNSTDSVDHHYSAKSDRHDHLFSPTNQQQLTKGKSAIGMMSNGAAVAPSSADGLLRKSATSASALYSSSPQHGTTANHFPTIPEDHGLTMSAGRDKMPQTAAAASPPKSGFMNFFGTGGFLSRPVTHTPEENYRLIMALDR